MAKTNVRRPSAVQVTKQQTKKQIAMGRKEARQRRIILLSVGAVALVVLVILVIGVLQEVVLAPAEPVAIVNGEKIRTDVFQDLVTYQRYNQYSAISSLRDSLDQLQTGEQQEGNEFLVSFYEQQLSQMQAQVSTIPQAALEELIEDVLIREKAEAEGITVTAADVEETIQADLMGAFAQSQEVLTDTQELPTATPVPQEDVDELYNSIIGNIKISDEAFRDIVQRSLLRGKVQELLAGEVVTTGLVVQAQLIKTETEEEALAAMERIEGGEEFAIVATEVSTDTTTAEQGGDLGWVTTGQLASRYGQALEDEVFALSPGEMTTVGSNDMFYVIQVLDRDENGPLPEAVVTQRRSSVLTDWLAERKASPEVEIERLLEEDQIPPDPFVIQS
ncbi:MAG TPA: peptidylprolyl isomerase [Anaerolineae bacterium]|nr:peptidylprolyl isomerase [Anaerolineae bacterium]